MDGWWEQPLCSRALFSEETGVMLDWSILIYLEL